MKKLLALFTITLLAFTAKADTNTPPATFWGGVDQILKATGLVTDPTNYAAALFYGKKTTGNMSSVGLLIIENVNNNLGVAAGVDTLWGGGKIGSANIVAGGLTLKEPTHPLKFLGWGSFTSNFVATPYAIALAGTPIRGTGNADGGLATISRVGINLDIFSFKKLKVGFGFDYGDRTGAGKYSGRWVDAEISGRIGF